jgi:hypothetical protein
MSEVAKPMTDDDLRAFGEWMQQRPCTSCHNPDFSGSEQMPRLAHQREEYLLRAMREYKSGDRIGYGSSISR